MKKKTFIILPGVVSILLAGCLLTLLTFQYFRWEIKNSVRQQMKEEAYVYTGMITNKVKHYITLMQSLGNFFKFSETVTRDEFTRFTAIMLSQEPGIKTLCWAPQVEPSQRQAYETNVRKEGFSGFTFHSNLDLEQSCETLFYPAYYVEPFEKDNGLFGYVLDREPFLSTAMEKAFRTALPASVINPLTVVAQKPTNSQSECWIIIPVLKESELNRTEEQRQPYLLGYLFGIIDVSTMVNNVLCGIEDKQFPIDIHIEDITAGRHQIFATGGLACCKSGFDSYQHQFVAENRFEFVDRVWKIYSVACKQPPLNTSNAWMVWLIFPVGGLLTGLLILYLYMLYCRNELAGNLVEKRTRELKEQKEKADAIAIEAERSSRAKSTFLAGLSHDIRTPMNVILGFCELLADESLSKDQKYYVDTIHSNSQNLLMLLSDILDLSKIEAGKLHIDRRGIDPQEMVNSIELMFRASTQNRGLEFRVISMTRLPRRIQSDPLRIRQCLVNLIGNAIKFTHQGHIFVSFSYEKERLKLSVEDTGVGIPEERLESIFNAFGTGSHGCDLENEYGSGLGLAITRKLARLMGGDVTVQSQTGKGSIFTLDIPAGLADNQLPEILQNVKVNGGWGDI